MSKFLTFEIKHSDPIPFILLHEERAIKQIMERHHHKDSLVYFICKVKKVRFDLETLGVNQDKAKIELLFEGIRIQTEIYFGKDHNMTVLENSNSRRLFIEVNGLREDLNPVIVTPDLVLRSNQIEIGNPPSIMYIGYSFDAIDRLLKHEKIVKAMPQLEDNEELRLYVTSYKFGYAETVPGKNVIIVDDIGIKKGVVDDATLKDYIKMTERILIHFFQTEGLNDNHINMNLMKDPLLKKLLRHKDIRFFGTGFDMEGGEYFNFTSPKQRSNNKEFCFDFENPSKGYITMEEAQKDFFN